MSDNPFIVVALFFLGALAIIIGVCFALIGTIGRWECSAKAEAMRLQYEFGVMSGCIVQYHGERVPIEAVGVRTIQVKP